MNLATVAKALSYVVPNMDISWVAVSKQPRPALPPVESMSIEDQTPDPIEPSHKKELASDPLLDLNLSIDAHTRARHTSSPSQTPKKIGLVLGDQGGLVDSPHILQRTSLGVSSRSPSRVPSTSLSPPTSPGQLSRRGRPRLTSEIYRPPAATRNPSSPASNSSGDLSSSFDIIGSTAHLPGTLSIQTPAAVSTLSSSRQPLQNHIHTPTNSESGGSIRRPRMFPRDSDASEMGISDVDCLSDMTYDVGSMGSGSAYGPLSDREHNMSRKESSLDLRAVNGSGAALNLDFSVVGHTSEPVLFSTGGSAAFDEDVPVGKQTSTPLSSLSARRIEPPSPTVPLRSSIVTVAPRSQRSPGQPPTNSLLLSHTRTKSPRVPNTSPNASPHLLSPPLSPSLSPRHQASLTQSPYIHSSGDYVSQPSPPPLRNSRSRSSLRSADSEDIPQWASDAGSIHVANQSRRSSFRSTSSTSSLQKQSLRSPDHRPPTLSSRNPSRSPTALTPMLTPSSRLTSPQQPLLDSPVISPRIPAIQPPLGSPPTPVSTIPQTGVAKTVLDYEFEELLEIQDTAQQMLQDSMSSKVPPGRRADQRAKATRALVAARDKLRVFRSQNPDFFDSQE